MIRVMLRGKRTLSAELLRPAIETNSRISVVLFTDSDDEMLAALSADRIDVVVFVRDHFSQKQQEMQTIKRICAAKADAKVIVLMDETDREVVTSAFTSGAHGVFSLSGSSLHMLCKCIERVHEGQIWATAEELNWIIQALQDTRPRQQRMNVTNALGRRLLSPREEDVVALLMEGLHNREIAQMLNLSEHTIKNYLFRIYDKLGISSRAELLLYVMSPAAVKEAS